MSAAAHHQHIEDLEREQARKAAAAVLTGEQKHVLRLALELYLEHWRSPFAGVARELADRFDRELAEARAVREAASRLVNNHPTVVIGSANPRA